MNFQSLHFLVFLFVLVIACGLLWRHFTARKNLLLVASYYFYMCWDWRFAGLLLGSTLLYYLCGQLVFGASSVGRRRLWLGLALVGGLGTLGYFKYANFFVQSAAELASVLGFQAHPAVLKLVLPIGISFFTFQGLSYVIDIYRRQLEPTNNLRDFALFVSFFPTVLAGPITRGGQLLPQLHRQHTVPAFEVEQGLALVVRGFVKKVVFADVLATELVDPAFADPYACSPLFLLLAVYAYSFQLYMDVSGYTDIARGAALQCGFRLPQNFDRPYMATSVSNFWQRWHMSMSGFFRDYVFIGMGGSRFGNVYLNLMVTFLAIGLWHGGGWNFLLYGLLHGGMVCIERALRTRRGLVGAPAVPVAGSGRQWLQIAWVLTFVSLTRILFRAPDLESAAHYLGAMLGGWRDSVVPFSQPGLALLVIAAVLHWGPRDWAYQQFARLRTAPVPLQALGLVGLVYVVMAFSSQRAPFVYFLF